MNPNEEDRGRWHVSQPHMQHEHGTFHSEAAAAAAASNRSHLPPSSFLPLRAADSPSAEEADASRSYDESSSCSRSSESPAHEGNDAWSPRMFEADPLMQQQQQHHHFHDAPRPYTHAAGQHSLFPQHSGASGVALTRPSQMRSVSTPLTVPAIQLPIPLSRRLLASAGGHHSPLPPHHDGPSPLERDPHTPMQHQLYSQQMQQQQQQHALQQHPSSPQLVKIPERVKRESPTLAAAAAGKAAAFSPYTSAPSSAAASNAGSPARSRKKKSSPKRPLFGEELERSNSHKAQQARELRARKGAYLAALEERIAQQQKIIAFMHARNINEPMDDAALAVDVPSELARLASLPPLLSPYIHTSRSSPRRQTSSVADSAEVPVQALVLSPSMRSRGSSVVTPSSFRSAVPAAAAAAAATGSSSSHPNTPSRSGSRLLLASHRRSVPSALDQSLSSPTHPHLSHSASPDAPRMSSSSSHSLRSMSVDQLYSLPEQAGNWAMHDHGHEVAAASGGGVLSPHLHQQPPAPGSHHWHHAARPSSAHQAPFMLPDAALQSRIVSEPNAQHAASASAAAAAASGSMHDTPPSAGAASSRVRSRAETPHVAAAEGSPHKRGRREDERSSPAMRHESQRPQGVPHVHALRPGSSTPLDVLHLGGGTLGRQLSSNDSVTDLRQLAISTPQLGSLAQHQPQQLPVLASPPVASAWLEGGGGAGMVNWPSTCASVAAPFVFSSSSASNFGTSLHQLSISSSPAAAAAAVTVPSAPLRQLQDAEPTQQSIFSAATKGASSAPQYHTRQG